MNKVILSGDISKIPSDAMMTAINSSGMWFGGIDGVIQGIAGSHYHNQAAAQSPLKHEQVVIAKGKGRAPFNDVIFVVDDLQSPLRNIIYKGLVAAHNAGYNHVTIPAIRTGVMLGVVEKNMTEAVREVAIGIKNFEDEFIDTTLDTITFVVFRNPEFQKLLEPILQKQLA